MQSKQVDSEAGNIGNILNIFPFSLSPIERAKEQGRINDMLDFDPKELYRYNKARGLDPDNPITWEAYKNLKSIHPGLGFREESAGGGIASIRRPWAIPPESGPDSQGLAYLNNYATKRTE